MQRLNFRVRNRSSFAIGTVMVLMGILLNKWFLEWAILVDGFIQGYTIWLIIIATQLTLIASGVFLLVNQPVFKHPGRPELIILLFAILVASILGETATRAYLRADTSGVFPNYSLAPKFEKPRERWSPHPYLNYYPTPNYRSGLRRHNSMGYRDVEFPIDKPAGTYRIVALGGSTTYTNAVVDNSKTFTAQLEKVLKNQYGYDDVQVINAGVAGYTTLESLINLEFRVLDLDPDLLIIYHGTNEVHRRRVDPSVYRGDNTGFVKQWDQQKLGFLTRSAFVSGALYNLRGIFRGLPDLDLRSRVRAPAVTPTEPSVTLGADSFLEQNPPVFFERNLRSMVAIAKEHDVDIMLATFAHTPQFPSHYAATAAYQMGFAEQNDVVEKVAADHNVFFLDFGAMMPLERRYWSDGVHFNEEGALLKANLFAEYIQEQNVIAESRRQR